MEKVIAEKVYTLVGMCKGNGFGWFMAANDIGNEIIALLKEQNRKLESIVSFENGDRVRAWHCPFCGSEYRIILKGPPASGAKTEE